MPRQPRWTERDIINAIRVHYLPVTAIQSGQEEWSLLTQVSSSRAFETLPLPSRSDRDISDEERGHITVLRRDRRIDVLLVRNWCGRIGHEIIAMEVKVTRADFFQDTEEKRRPWWLLSNKFAYVVPAGMVGPEEVPSGCGLVEITGGPCRRDDPHTHTPACVGVLSWNRAARIEKRVIDSIPLGLAVEFARRASRTEGRVAAALPQLTDTDTNTPVSDPNPQTTPASTADAYAALLQKVKHLSTRDTNHQRQLDTLRAERRATVRAVAPLFMQTCADCGQPIIARYIRGMREFRWEHTPPDGSVITKREMDTACPGRTAYLYPAVLAELDTARGDTAVASVLNAALAPITENTSTTKTKAEQAGTRTSGTRKR